ncbi:MULTISPECIES: dTDP-4-dehydrorhamnose reductase [unclassified Sphingomonas]|jgi:dTDP-4-dehydrorhamnose reductase|uniref:dTDP-4-dehydrorhamnose reductase n=1 Tax=unclassified Sphingomonas TaxID=196159 RepID=UPI000836DAE6|nr:MULTISPECIES: dTDP-4-dehydrorhamnose reductase [unclassified Sphingomonas]
MDGASTATREILVTGGSGQVGTELQRLAMPPGWRIVAPPRGELDLADPRSIAAAVRARPWAAIINAGAYTAVDQAESDVVAAWQVNAMAPAALAAAATEAGGIPIVHVSTDYVFPGDRAGAWEVDDPVAPLGVYGASKLAGELAIGTAQPRHAIVRTAWVVSAHGRNFVKTMLRLAADRDVLRVVADQHGSLTAAADLAAALAAVAIRMAQDDGAPTGIFHFANQGPTTWHGVAEAVLKESAARGGPSAQVLPISSAEYPTPARRPANSLLSTARITRDYGIAPRPWQVALNEILDELLAAPGPATA